eukprot:TRINITY_DN2537_c0_g1_i3.p1 TRINITY_DN2537_c0_g1~~TRINITY_DN2537_c0_g1_i3.p1  ORF type:complete len:725 (+),score=101.03 TRINITY_DN2537_c0_g1_i3:51-2225(+)
MAKLRRGRKKGDKKVKKQTPTEETAKLPDAAGSDGEETPMDWGGLWVPLEGLKQVKSEVEVKALKDEHASIWVQATRNLHVILSSLVTHAKTSSSEKPGVSLITMHEILAKDDKALEEARRDIEDGRNRKEASGASAALRLLPHDSGLLAPYTAAHAVVFDSKPGLHAVVNEIGIPGFLAKVVAHDPGATPAHRMLDVAAEVEKIPDDDGDDSDDEAQPGAELAIRRGLSRFAKLCLKIYKRDTEEPKGLGTQYLRSLCKETYMKDRAFQVLLLGDSVQYDAFGRAKLRPMKDINLAEFITEEDITNIASDEQYYGTGRELLDVKAVLLFGLDGWQAGLAAFVAQLQFVLNDQVDHDDRSPRYLHFAFVLPPPDDDPLKRIAQSKRLPDSVAKEVEDMLGRLNGHRYCLSCDRSGETEISWPGPHPLARCSAGFPVYSFRHRIDARGAHSYPTPMMRPVDIVRMVWKGYTTKWLKPYLSVLQVHTTDWRACGDMEVFFQSPKLALDDSDHSDDSEDAFLHRLVQNIAKEVADWGRTWGQSEVPRLMVNKARCYTALDASKEIPLFVSSVDGLTVALITPFRVGDMVEVAQGGAKLFAPGRVVEVLEDECLVRISTEPPYTAAHRTLPDLTPRLCPIHTAQHQDGLLQADTTSHEREEFVWDWFLTTQGHTPARRRSFYPLDGFYSRELPLEKGSSDSSGNDEWPDPPEADTAGTEPLEEYEDDV